MTKPRELTPVSLIAMQRATSTVSGSDVDLAAYTSVQHREVKMILAIDSSGADTDETCDVTLQESATTVTSDFADISGAAFAQYTQEAAAALQEIHVRVSKRYVRAIATLAGTTPSFDIAALLLVPSRH